MLSNLQEHVALWSGKKFVVYNVSQEKTLVRVAGKLCSYLRGKAGPKYKQNW